MRPLALAASLLVLSSVAHAQDAERRTSEAEMTAAITLYSVGGASMLAGAIMLPIGIFDLNGIYGSSTPDDGAALYWAGIATLALGGIAVLCAVGLTIDAALRNGRLDARRSGITLAPGGLTVSLGRMKKGPELSLRASLASLLDLPEASKTRHCGFTL